MRDTHYIREQEEFLFLLRFNLLAYLKIFTPHHPDKNLMNTQHYDTVETIRTKLANVIHYDKPARINAQEFPIKTTIPEIRLETFADLEAYIVDLNKRKAGYQIRAMAYNEPLNITRNKFNAFLWEVMYSNSQDRLTTEAEQAIQYLVEAAELTEQEENGFYSDLVYNPYTLNGILAIVHQTCEEFKHQVFDTETAEEIIGIACGCTTRGGEAEKSNYIRKSFALMIAYNAVVRDEGKALWVYRCNKVRDKEIWHITHQRQRR